VSIILPDLRHAREGLAMLGRECDPCSLQPSQVRMHKTFKLLKAMFPGFRVSKQGWNVRQPKLRR
jgi:hypothetical protein